MTSRPRPCLRCPSSLRTGSYSAMSDCNGAELLSELLYHWGADDADAGAVAPDPAPPLAPHAPSFPLPRRRLPGG
jgi:hypothetical protein